MIKVLAEDLRALEVAIEVHERAPVISLHIVKIMIAAGYSDSDIRLAAATMASYVD